MNQFPVPDSLEVPQNGEVDPAPPLPTGAVTLLLTDIEGSTLLWESSEEVATVAVARHHELLHVAVARHGGVRPEEQGEGDSVVAAFASPSDALAAALDAQLAFREDLWPEGATVRVRIAVHSIPTRQSRTRRARGASASDRARGGRASRRPRIASSRSSPRG